MQDNQILVFVRKYFNYSRRLSVLNGKEKYKYIIFIYQRERVETSAALFMVDLLFIKPLHEINEIWSDHLTVWQNFRQHNRRSACHF